MRKRVRKEIVIGSSGIVLIVTIIVVGLVLILNQSIKPANNQTETNVTTQIEQIFYRFENNECKYKLLITSEKTLNDYSTLSQCQSRIVIAPPVKHVPAAGDFYKFDELKLGENLFSVKSFLSEEDMPNFLRHFYLEDKDAHHYWYTQKILLDGNKMNFTIFRDSDYEGLVGLTERTNVTGFKIRSNTFIFNYSIDFSEPVPWDKLVGSEIYLFAKKFTIIKVSDSPLSITLESEKGNRIDLISDSNIEINYNYNDDLRAHIIRETDGSLTKLVIGWKTGDDYFLTSDLDFVLPFFNIINFTLENVHKSANESYGTVYLRTQEPVEEQYVVPVVSPPTGGDRFLIERTGDKLNLGDSLNGIYPNTLRTSEMPHFLKILFLLASENHPYYYEQDITLGNMTLSIFRDSDYENLTGLTEPTNVTGFKLDTNISILKYIIYFYMNLPVNDAKNSKIYIIGKEFSIDNIDASNLSMNLTDSEGNKLYLENNKKIIFNGEKIDELSSFFQFSSDKLFRLIIEWRTNKKTFVTKEMELPIPYFKTLKFVFEGMNSVPDNNGQLYGNMTLVSQ
jgi:hypothetical protein